MRQVKFLADVGDYKSGDVALVDDDLACGAIASGVAVPSIEPLPADAAPESDAIIEAPETVAFERAPETI